MTSTLKIALLATAVTMFAPSPTFAASATTDAFVANVRPRLDFLDQASRLAIAATRDARVRAFARDEAVEETRGGTALAAWSQTNRTRVAAAQTPRAPGVDDMLTGRSVAIDAPDGGSAAVRTPAPGTLLPSQDAELRHLSASKGRRFDALYVSTQAAVLGQLATLYADYARQGDDPELRAMAAGELQVVRQQLLRTRGL